MNEVVNRIASKHNYDVSFFEQSQVVYSIKHPLSSSWTTVYTHSSITDNTPAIFCCFAELVHQARILEGTDWIKHADSFTPGFSIGSGSVHFESSCCDGFHFIVMEQSFHSLGETQLHINQEFVLLFELYRSTDGNYYSIDECGSQEIVVDFSEQQVRVKTKYLLRYMCARQLLFVQFIDSRVSTPGRFPSQSDVFDAYDEVGQNYVFKRWYQGSETEDYLLSTIHARSFVNPGPVEKCGLWPYGEGDEYYPEFIIGELPDGTYERFTCDESKLRNNPGANPGAPYYLTPVFFQASVLDKYRKDKHFDVNERRLSCGGQWSIKIDNVAPGRVMVYLGDLGKYLPESERRHFQAYEISPVGQSISDEVYANDFRGCFVDSSGPVGSLLDARKGLNDAWEGIFDKPLYRPFHQEDDEITKGIRVPASNGEEEFNTVILNITKLLIDYIDETHFADIAVDGSINKLETFLDNNGINLDISPLRDLQKIRSNSAAHSKGEKYERLVGKVITGDSAKDTLSLIERLVKMLDELAAAIEHKTDEQGDVNS